MDDGGSRGKAKCMADADKDSPGTGQYSMKSSGFPQPVKCPQFREGHGWRIKDLEAYLINSDDLALNPINGRSKSSKPIEDGKEYYIMSDVERAYEEATAKVGSALAAYQKTMDSFRSTIKNDLSSISASAQKVQNEAMKANAAYKQITELMLSENIALAISNVERLAAALKALNEVDPHKITFEVGDASR